MPFAATRMNLEIVMVSEVCHTAKNKNIVWHLLYVESKINYRNKLMYIMETIDLQKELMVPRGEEWRKEIVREFGIDMYTLLY